MKLFSELLDRLAFEPSRNAKLRLIEAYFREARDPDRGWALAAMTGALSFSQAKPALIRALVAERTDPALFALSYDYIGDLAETAALIWPVGEVPDAPPPRLSEVVETLTATGKLDLRGLIARWMDALSETERWALLKLITGSLRIGVSARLAKTALARLGGHEPDDVEEVWHGAKPPYRALFAWVEGKGPRPLAQDLAPFRTPMLAHPLDEKDLATLDPSAFSAEWKWDGIRCQAAAGPAGATRDLRLYSRTGDDITRAFPDIADALSAIPQGFAIDGELLVVREGRVEPFGVLQQRLNRKVVSGKVIAEYPAHIRAYDILSENGEDLRGLPFLERRARLESFVTHAGVPALDLSPIVPFHTWDDVATARADPASAGGDAAAIEGLMLKRRDSLYLPGRPKGPWFKWKRAPFNVDAVMMYAQRGHGKRSSFYSDYTFGVWKDGALVPVGKAYSGFTDEELLKLDRFVRNNTQNRFGPVREVAHGEDVGLVLEIAFEGLNRSTRHKSGVAMRFPRVNRIRWDKPPREADTIETLEVLLRD